MKKHGRRERKNRSISRSFPVLFSIGRHICVSFFGFHFSGIRIRFRFRNSLGGTRICDTRVCVCVRESFEMK